MRRQPETGYDFVPQPIACKCRQGKGKARDARHNQHPRGPRGLKLRLADHRSPLRTFSAAAPLPAAMARQPKHPRARYNPAMPDPKPDDVTFHEETDSPTYADARNFYKVEKWTRDGTKVDSLLYAGNSLARARGVFERAIKHSAY